MKRARAYFHLLRVFQWYKNLVIFVGPLFGGFIFSINPIKALLAFLSFSLMASTVYIINDIRDVERDRRHPKKRHRPIASGIISKKGAFLLGSLLGMLSIMLTELFVKSGSSIFLLGYLFLMILYTFVIKNIVFLDILTVASGFLVRVLYGCYSFNILPSKWLYLIVFLLAVYLAIAKRVANTVIGGEVLEVYIKYGKALLYTSAFLVIVSYFIYTLQKGNFFLKVSNVLVVIGILLHLRESLRGKELHEMLLDPKLLIIGIVYLINILIAIYQV